MVEYLQGKTPDSSIRALWESLQQSHLVAKQLELGKGNYEFGLPKYLSSYFKGILNMSYNLTWSQKLHFSSEGRHAVEFYCP
jgi:hypothetical protein